MKKKCIKCEKLKPAKHFRLSDHKAGERLNVCYDCRTGSMKKYRESRKDPISELLKNMFIWG